MSEAIRATERWLDSGRFLDRDAGPEAADLIRALRAENERLREALRREAFWLESQRFDGTAPSVFEARAASIRAALASIGGAE